MLKFARKIHRTSGAVLFIFFFLVAITGLFLGWKKHSGGIILADSVKGSSTEPKDWLPIHQLRELAIGYARKNISATISTEIDRIDVRPDKGMVKFVFVEGYWGIQVDCTTGEMLHIERRYSDLIENIHDGSYGDRMLDTSSGVVKLVYTTMIGLALLTFTVTGFWLWFGPKRFKKRNRELSASSLDD
ncbi:MAG: PepSY-associated TM helix domain-containing protein [Pyrinomonadaceae bacterium]